MPSDTELDRVCVVLVRARNPSNIGAAARAMHDFGFGRLRVVNQFSPPMKERAQGWTPPKVWAMRRRKITARGRWPTALWGWARPP